MKDKSKTIEVLNEDVLLNILGERFKDFSNKKIKSFVKYKMVEVDGHVVTNSSQIVGAGSIIKVYFNKRSISKCELDVVYEDDDIIVIDKPHGLLSVSNNKEKERTAFRLVSDYIKMSNKNAKLFVVHRLDRDTSGLLLFAKNQSIKEKLQSAWNDIVMKREYVAVLEGELKTSGTMKSYLAMNKFQKMYSTKNVNKGELAITHYKPIKSENGMTLAVIDIDTGKKNQIRVHMSELGYPIVGDKKYGAKINFERLALHASKLYLRDPRSGNVLKFESAVPRKLLNLVNYEGNDE